MYNLVKSDEIKAPQKMRYFLHCLDLQTLVDFFVLQRFCNILLVSTLISKGFHNEFCICLLPLTVIWRVPF